MKHFFFVILISSFLIDAKAQKKQSIPMDFGVSAQSNATGTKNKVEDKKSEEQRIAVATLKITKSKNQYSVSLTKTRILNTAKSIVESPAKWNENDFVCFVLSERKQIVDTLVVQQPLNVRYEFPKEDGTIGFTVVDLSENEVLLRFRYTKQMRYLRVARVVEGGKLKIVDVLRLQQEK